MCGVGGTEAAAAGAVVMVAAEVEASTAVAAGAEAVTAGAALEPLPYEVRVCAYMLVCKHTECNTRVNEGQSGEGGLRRRGRAGMEAGMAAQHLRRDCGATAARQPRSLTCAHADRGGQYGVNGIRMQGQAREDHPAGKRTSRCKDQEEEDPPRPRYDLVALHS